MYGQRPAGKSAGFSRVRGNEMQVFLGDLLDPQERNQLIRAYRLPPWEQTRQQLLGAAGIDERAPVVISASRLDEVEAAEHDRIDSRSRRQLEALMQERPRGTLAVEV